MQQAGAQIDRQDRIIARPPTLNLIQRPVADGGAQAGIGQRIHEGGRLQHSLLGMRPAQQGLVGMNMPVAERNHGLEMQLELMLPDRLAQFVFQCMLGSCMCGQFGTHVAEA